MSKPKWNKCAPPSIGWWPASGFKDNLVIRWWNGRWWSRAAFPEWSANEAKDVAGLKAADQEYIEWTDRWWE